MSNLRFPLRRSTSLPATMEVRHGHQPNGAFEPEELHERTPKVVRASQTTDRTRRRCHTHRSLSCSRGRSAGEFRRLRTYDQPADADSRPGSTDTMTHHQQRLKTGHASCTIACCRIVPTSSAYRSPSRSSDSIAPYSSCRELRQASAFLWSLWGVWLFPLLSFQNSSSRGWLDALVRLSFDGNQGSFHASLDFLTGFTVSQPP